MIPRNMEEYQEQFMAASKTTGYGIDVAQHMPCPWCCFKDFMVLKPARGIMPGDPEPGVEEVMAAEHKCQRCGRSGKNLVNRDENGVSFEFVQTGGPPPPAWLDPPPRRVEDGDAPQ